MPRPPPVSETDSSTSEPRHASAGMAVERLSGIMARLRAPDGCPWDREQTLASLRPYLIEEAYEVLEALDADDVDEHRVELGDLLLQVVFQAQLRSEQGAFGLAEVADAISQKLLRRHPHVFGDRDAPDAARSADEVARQWARIKAAERQEKTVHPSAIDGVPRALPALIRAQRTGEKASRVGFDWPDAAGVRAKVDEELAEVDAAVASGDPARVADELGDLLFSVAQWSRHLGVAPEDALRAAIDKFSRRFRTAEELARARGTSLDRLDAPALDTLWTEAKRLATPPATP